MLKLKDIPHQIVKLWKFVTEDVWRVIPSELSATKKRGYNFLKVVSLAIRRYQEDDLQSRASALTYSTFLSLVPLLAVLLAIAKGFGFRNIVESQLFDYFPGQKEFLSEAFTYVDSYMNQSKEGVFIGMGILLLLYTVFNLISSIENTFNQIWQVSKGRSYGRRITDYFSVFLLLPVFLICSSGLSIFLNTAFNTLKNYEYFTPIYEAVITIIPIIVTVFTFTALYIYMPNTKVQFKHAFYAGIFSGITFQIFQYIYISGQIWVSKYNAIFGSFALLPLLLLWMQLSWVICLLGAEITYAGQNVRDYEFEADSKKITRRYFDFLVLTIAALIVKRFEKGLPSYTSDEISADYKIPIRLTNRILFYLIELEIINEVKDEDQFPNYQPALDINKISLGYLFSKIDQYGSENFKVDNDIEFRSEWDAIVKSREDMFSANKDVLLKDL